MSSAKALGRCGVWLQRHGLFVDAVIATALAALSLVSMYVTADYLRIEAREPDALGVLLVLATCLPLVWRRRQPLVVAVAVAVASAVFVALGYPGGASGAGILIAVYTVAAYCERRLAVVAAVLSAVLAAIPLPFQRQPWGVADVLAIVGLILAAFAFGRSIGFRRAYTAELELRAIGLEQAREADLRAVVAEERSRIARELHDVVAHHVSVMTVQASGARRTVHRDPERSAEAMAAVEATGRAALAEMRRIVGVLRADGEEPVSELAPQPGIADLDALVDQVREAGLTATMSVLGEPRPVPVGVDLTIYRVVQEALTNTLKHGGPTAAHVALAYEPAAVSARVLDEGLGAAAALPDRAEDRAGHGLLGMRERTALYGGQLRAGPRSGGGYEVWVRIPVDPPPPVRTEHAPHSESASRRPGQVPA